MPERKLPRPFRMHSAVSYTVWTNCSLHPGCPAMPPLLSSLGLKIFFYIEKLSDFGILRFSTRNTVRKPSNFATLGGDKSCLGPIPRDSANKKLGSPLWVCRYIGKSVFLEGKWSKFHHMDISRWLSSSRPLQFRAIPFLVSYVMRM